MENEEKHYKTLKQKVLERGLHVKWYCNNL